MAWQKFALAAAKGSGMRRGKRRERRAVRGYRKVENPDIGKSMGLGWKILFIILGFILAKKYIFKGEEFGGGLGSGDWKDKVIGNVGSTWKLSSGRRLELQTTADKVYVSMDGPGMYIYDFVSYMEEINTDDEWAYFLVAFGTRDGADFGAWVADEWMMTDATQKEVNDTFKEKGMTARI